MNKGEAIKYCHDNRDNFIRDFENIDEGIEQFNGLVSCVESGHIKTDELSNYGMPYSPIHFTH